MEGDQKREPLKTNNPFEILTSRNLIHAPNHRSKDGYARVDKFLIGRIARGERERELFWPSLQLFPTLLSWWPNDPILNGGEPRRAGAPFNEFTRRICARSRTPLV